VTVLAQRPTIPHPHWCSRPPGEERDEVHVSHPVPCNPGGNEIVEVYMRLEQSHYANHAGAPVWLVLEVVDGGQRVEHYLSMPQGQVIGHAVRRLGGVAG
jgi:hypothetical protein